MRSASCPSLSLFLFGFLLVPCSARYVSGSFSLSLPLPRSCSFEKKKEDLGQFLSHKPADRTAPIKNASLRMAIGPQRASGVMPNRSLSPSSPRGLPFAVGVSFRRAFSSSLLVFLVRSLVLLYLFRSFLLFFQRGEKMRAARRLVEGTDDVVSDVPPPALGVGMHARRWWEGARLSASTSIAGCIYRGEGEGVACEGVEREEGRGAPQIELEILLYIKGTFAKSPRDRKRNLFNRRIISEISTWINPNLDWEIDISMFFVQINNSFNFY